MCDTVVVVDADRVWFAKCSDRDPNEPQPIEWHEAAEHADGATVTCTYLEIPQARRTNRIMISRPAWMWGAEIGTNEHGVTIGNEAVFTKAAVPKRGLTGMDLLRLALERADTAARAVETIVRLASDHGQGGGCGFEKRSFRYFSSYLVADTKEAYVLETTKDDHAVERVTGARSISNALTIPDFAKRHASWLESTVARAAARRDTTESCAAGVRSFADLAALTRRHGAGSEHPRFSPLNGAMDGPCMHAGGLAAASQTTAAWIAELRPDGVHHWVTGTAAPCTSIYKPVDPDTPVDIDAEALWWAHERLHRRTMRDPATLLPLYRAERDELEAAWFAERPASAEAFAEAESRLATWTARVESAPNADVRPAWLRRYWAKRPLPRK